MGFYENIEDIYDTADQMFGIDLVELDLDDLKVLRDLLDEAIELKENE